MYLNLAPIQHYCAYQERCHSEVKQKLYELGFRGNEVEEALAELISENFLNEERYARAYVRGKFNNNHWGRNKILQALKQKQVSAYCIKKGMQEIDEEAYLETIAKLAEKKFYELRGERLAYIRKQKVQRYLVQKGFEYDIIADVLKEK